MKDIVGTAELYEYEVSLVSIKFCLKILGNTEIISKNLQRLANSNLNPHILIQKCINASKRKKKNLRYGENNFT